MLLMTSSLRKERIDPEEGLGRRRGLGGLGAQGIGGMGGGGGSFGWLLLTICLPCSPKG